MSISYRSNRDPARVRANEYFVSELICCTNKICICPNLGRISVFTTFQLSQLITQPTLVFQKTLKNQTLVYCPYSNPTLQKVCLRPFWTWVFALWSLKSSFASAKCPCAQPPIYLLTLIFMWVQFQPWKAFTVLFTVDIKRAKTLPPLFWT